MNKTILYLINGLGIEKSDSYSIYNTNLMPNFNNLMSKGLFSSIESQAFNYKTAYQLFSTGSNKEPEYAYMNSIINNNQLQNSKNFNILKEKIKDDNNFHIFTKIDNDIVIEQLNEFIKNLDIKENKKIYIHLILTGNKIDEYKKIIKRFSTLRYRSISQIKFGTIFGSDLITSQNRINDLKSLIKLMFKGLGEKWTDVEKKLTTLAKTNVLPQSINPFYVNDFKLGQNDTILFFNYELDNYDYLINNIKDKTFLNREMNLDNLLFVSLFPLNSTLNIPSLFGKAICPYSLDSAIKQADLKALIITDKENINIINYMANGLTNVISDNIKYMVEDETTLSDSNRLSSIINNPDFPLIIINTRIDNLNSVEEIKNKLSQIDENIKMVNDICNSTYNLIISSLFGIQKSIYISNNDHNTVNINFYGSVPIIYLNPNYNKRQYYLTSGNIYTLLGTSIKSSNPDIKFPTLLRKKGFFKKLLKK